MRAKRDADYPIMPAEFIQDDARWRAVIDKDTNADGVFFFAVKTTGIYCWPSCGSRIPKRENVEFFACRDDAEAHGFRPCRRCRPDLPPLAERHATAMHRVCEAITHADTSLPLAALAEIARMSPHYFQRTFKRIVGITPKQYELALRDQRIKTNLRDGVAVTDAIYSAGYNAASRYYEHAQSRLGMTATERRKGGKGLEIVYTITDCWLGRVLVGATSRGICAIFIGTDDAQLTRMLEQQYPAATIDLADGGSRLDKWVARAVAMIEQPDAVDNLPLDVVGTAFQERVWRALLDIAPGATATYSDIAKQIGAPNAVRAVATACASNPAAVAIPCHRIVRRDGQPSGYRWGIERKRKLLAKETEKNGKKSAQRAS